MKLHLALIFVPLFVAGQGNSILSEEPLITYASINNSLLLENTARAIGDFERMLAGSVDKTNIQKLAEDYFGMALALALNGNYRESIYYHRKALRAHRKAYHEKSLEMTINLGLTYQLAGKDKKARRILGELYNPPDENHNAS
ncbi:MAG TPA: tetratricopeptide repeat protein [Chryseosolibacter sp.]|nr:tetratricopeptide repeat protein [Chryseosolibacter sp.]